MRGVKHTRAQFGIAIDPSAPPGRWIKGMTLEVSRTTEPLHGRLSALLLAYSDALQRLPANLSPFCDYRLPPT